MICDYMWLFHQQVILSAGHLWYDQGGAVFFFVSFADDLYRSDLCQILSLKSWKKSGGFCCFWNPSSGTSFSLFFVWKNGVCCSLFFPTLPRNCGGGIQEHMSTPLEISPDPLFSALGGPSVWSWEEDHGRPCGLSKWHCFLGLKVGGLGRWVFSSQMEVDLERCWGVFFLKGGEGWNLTSERKISSSCFFKVWEGGREGGDLISQWFFCGSFRVRKWFGILFQTRVYYSGTSQLYKPLTQTTKEHQFPISCNGGPKISHKRHQLKKGFNRWRMMENNDAEKWSGMVATTWSR